MGKIICNFTYLEPFVICKKALDIENVPTQFMMTNNFGVL